MADSVIFEYTSATFSSHKVRVAETYETMEELARLILESKEMYFGFDTEMIDTRREPDKYALTATGTRFSPTIMIQLAGNSYVYIFHFHGMMPPFKNPPIPSSSPLMILPPTLQQILRSDRIVKIGVATHNDTEGLSRTFGLGGVAQLLDLRAEGLRRGISWNSLSDVAKWAGIQGVDKQTSHDWCRSLQNDTYGGVSTKDLDYAALDAIACYVADKILEEKLLGVRERSNHVEKVEEYSKTNGFTNKQTNRKEISKE